MMAGNRAPGKPCARFTFAYPAPVRASGRREGRGQILHPLLGGEGSRFDPTKERDLEDQVKDLQKGTIPRVVRVSKDPRVPKRLVPPSRAANLSRSPDTRSAQRVIDLVAQSWAPLQRIDHDVLAVFGEVVLWKTQSSRGRFEEAL